MAITIGIDLGTSNSCAAAVIDGIPQIIRLPSGDSVMPSVFTIDQNGNRLIGKEANEADEELEIIAATKRLIGRNFHSRAVEDMRQIFTYELMEGVDENVLVKIKDQILTLEEISGAILEKLKRNASEALNAEIEQAVITVPAYFNDRQRQAVKKAGALAGLDIIRIINEPTAAALAYGFRKTLNKRVAVFDLGGGTFDISVIEIQENVFEVIASGGNPNLGGVDFDDRLMKHMLETYFNETGLDLSIDRVALKEIREAAEAAKIKLSTVEHVQVHLPELKTEDEEKLPFKMDLSRTLLESLTTDLVDSAIGSFKKILLEAGTSIRDLEEVLLVGGQSRMPLVKQKLHGLLGYEPAHKVHPDQAVALGAAMMAHALTDQAPDKIKLLDVLPMSIGLPRGDGKMQVLFPKNIPLPCERTRQIRTFKHNQKSMMIRLYQGEDNLIENNEQLCTYVFKGLRPTPKAKLTLAVSFLIDANGMLHISARDKTTGVPVETLSNVRFTPEPEMSLNEHPLPTQTNESPPPAIEMPPPSSADSILDQVAIDSTLSDLIKGELPIEQTQNREAHQEQEESMTPPTETNSESPDLPDFFPNLKEKPIQESEKPLLNRPLEDLQTNFESHDFEDMDAELPNLSTYQNQHISEQALDSNEIERDSSTFLEGIQPTPVAPTLATENEREPLFNKTIQDEKTESSVDVEHDSPSDQTKTTENMREEPSQNAQVNSLEDDRKHNEPQELFDDRHLDVVEEDSNVLQDDSESLSDEMAFQDMENQTELELQVPIEIPNSEPYYSAENDLEQQKSRQIEMGFFGEDDSESEEMHAISTKRTPKPGFWRRFWRWLTGQSREQ